MSIPIYSVIISYNRLPLLQMTVESYRDTITGPHTLFIVDNNSDNDTIDWIRSSGIECLYLKKNRYPGFATNKGFGRAPCSAPILHRSDNDIEYLPGWADEVRQCITNGLGQVSLRTDEEELHQDAVGGNMAINRVIWDAGIRYTPKSWAKVPWEDGLFNRKLRDKGFTWGRVSRPCIIHRGSYDPNDPYVRETYRIRGIEHLLIND